jgi:hypothetical protein
MREEEYMVKVAGKNFRCECGCNVFHKDEEENYVCNCCGNKYTPEKEGRVDED